MDIAVNDLILHGVGEGYLLTQGHQRIVNEQLCQQCLNYDKCIASRGWLVQICDEYKEEL